MSQRLTQTPGGTGHALDVNGRQPVGAHEQLASILASRLGRDHADLLATPKLEADGKITWSTPLAGEITPATQLPAEERRRLEQRAERILADVRGLAEQLRSEGPAAQMAGDMLAQAAQVPAGDWLYRVGGKPVLVMWGHGDSPMASRPEAAAPAAGPPAAALPSGTPPFGAPPAVEAAVGAAAAPAASDASPGDSRAGPWKRRLPWLLPLIALLALLAWGLGRIADAPVQSADLSIRLAEAEARNKAMEQEIAQRHERRSQLQCVPEPQPPASVPEPPAQVPEPRPVPAVTPPPELPSPQPAAKAEPDPYDVLKKRVDAARQDCAALQGLLTKEPLLQGSQPRAAPLKQQVVRLLEGNCRENLIKEAKNLCPGQRPRELAPELVLVFDASGSMKFSLLATDQEIEQMAAVEALQSMMRQFGLGQGPGAASHAFREPTRITVARQAAISVVRKVPSDANVGLVMVDACPAARSAGYFPPGRRGELLSRLQSIEPQQGTPLADGVAKAGQMLDGVRREAIMVVVSDGKESCNQDPCAVASALARVKPHLRINVVDITGTGAGNCLARATNGKVFTARNAAEVASMTARAAEDALGPSNCSAK